MVNPDVFLWVSMAFAFGPIFFLNVNLGTKSSYHIISTYGSPRVIILLFFMGWAGLWVVFSQTNLIPSNTVADDRTVTKEGRRCWKWECPPEPYTSFLKECETIFLGEGLIVPTTKVCWKGDLINTERFLASGIEHPPTYVLTLLRNKGELWSSDSLNDLEQIVGHYLGEKGMRLESPVYNE